MPIERKLAAIMFTDIAGYTAQMSKDEAVAISLLNKKKVFQPLLKKYNGKLVKEMGDGTLSHFPSSVDATNCSIELQKNLKKNTNINVRVGVHHGEVLFKNKDVYGDVVNIASRLETMSPAGGVLVSKNVYDELSNRKGYDGISLGLQSLKGIGRLVEVYGLKGDMLNEPSLEDYTDTKIETHSDKEVPSIAIIPFENKGADKDVFYAYGISVDLISDVSSAGLIRVASKKQIDDAGDLTQDKLAKVLDVRYMANGELWRMGDMFQLSVELYDTKDKKVVWSDRWQEKWDNLTTIKGSLSDGLLKALDTKPKVEKKVETTNTEAYEFYLKAKHKFEKRENTDDVDIARGLLNKAIEIDGKLLTAKNLLGAIYSDLGNYDKAMKIYDDTLKQAKKLGALSEISAILTNIGSVKSDKGEYDRAIYYHDKSLEIKKKINDKLGMTVVLNNLGTVYYYKGEYDKAIKYHKTSLNIKTEIDDKGGIGISFGNIAVIYSVTGEYDKALHYYNKSFNIFEEVGFKQQIGTVLNNIGLIHQDRGDYKKALHYYERSLKIKEKLNDKFGIGHVLNAIGNIYFEKGNIDKALHYYEKSLNMSYEYELGDKRGEGSYLIGIGNVYYERGDMDTALRYYDKSLIIFKDINYKFGMVHSLNPIGRAYMDKNDYNMAIEYLEKSLHIQKETGLKEESLILNTYTYLFLNYKQLGKNYDINKIHSLIKEVDNIECELNYRLYELLEDKSYLETAHNQIQEKADNLEPDIAAKFLSYPIPSAIVEEWEKVK